MTETVSNSHITIGWVISQIEREFNVTTAQTNSWKAETISAGQGFLSNIHKIDFEWTSQNAALPNSLALKVPSLGALEAMISSAGAAAAPWMEALKKILPVVHNSECAAYEWLAQIRPKIPMPHIVAVQRSDAENPGAILMQYLDGCQMPDLADGLSLKQAFQVADVLAVVHAHSLRDPGWRDTLRPVDKETFMMSAAQLPKVVPKIASLYGEEMVGRFASWFDANRLYDLAFSSHEKLGLPPVLVHGDAWCNNFLFDGEDREKFVALIDWQAAHAGNCAADFSRMILLCMDPLVRRQETDCILEHYYNRLTGAMSPNEPPYSLADVRRAYDAFMPFTTVFVLAGLPYTPVFKNAPDLKEREKKMIDRGKAILEDVLAVLER